MIRSWIPLIFFLFSCISFTADAQLVTEQKLKAITAPPNPNELQAGWWQYFNVPEPELEKHLESFVKPLDLFLEETPDESDPEVSKWIDRIRQNVQTYLQALRVEPELLAPAQPLKELYTIVEVVEMNRGLRVNQSILEADLEELEDIKARVNTAIQRLEKLNATYTTLEKRSVSRLIKGLEIIAFRFSLETAKEQKKDLEKSIKIQQQRTKRLQEDLRIAIERLGSTKQSTELLERKVEMTFIAWREAQEELERKRAETITSFSFTYTTPEAKLQSQIVEEELLILTIKTAIREVEYLLASAEFLMNSILLREVEVDHLLVTDQVRNWESRLNFLKKQSEEWQRQLNRAMQRAEIIRDSEFPQLQEQVFTKVQESLLQLQKLDLEIKDTFFVTGLILRQVALFEGGLLRFLWQALDLMVSTATTFWESATQVLFYVGETPFTAISILQFLIIILLTIWISHLSTLALTQIAARRQGMKKSLLYRLKRLFQYSIFALGFIIALSSIGFDFSNFVLIAGALGVGLGFGLQSIFNNFISGIIILFESQLKVGDYIEMESGIRGEVKEINFRSTYIKTNDGVAIIVPNSEFINFRVVNWTLKEPYRRVRIPFSVDYESDKNLVVKVVIEAAKSVPLTLKMDNVPDPRVCLTNLGADGIEFELFVWVDEKATKRTFSTRSVYLWAIHDAFKKNNISIPFPQRVLHFGSESPLMYKQWEKES
ncbi:MAG: hypothetical protein Tsb0021_15960 [Chlamydiales bacterium]